MRLALALALAAAPALAETPLTAQDFDALTQGRTMTWAAFGQVYGVEHYLPGQGVRWAVTGQDCVAGQWYTEGPAICFRYEDHTDPACWIITASGSTLLARLLGAPPDRPPVEIVETTAPLTCLGPEVGV